MSDYPLNYPTSAGLPTWSGPAPQPTVPPSALLDEAGEPILDEAGEYILDESA